MLPEVESIGVQSLWLVEKALPSWEEADISLSIMNSKAHLHLVRYVYYSPEVPVAHSIHVAMILYVCILNV